MNYIKKHSKFLLSVLLFLVCFVLFFINMGQYPLMDTMETKYVSIAKDMMNSNDWVNLKLNGDNFVECPPFLFWIINLSYIAFAKINTFIARFPIALLATIGIISLFLTVSKILTRSYALIISLITLASFSFLLYGRLATLDIPYTITTMLAVLFAYLIIISNSKESKTKLWILVYIFTALSILTAGVFGLLPLIAIAAMCIFSGKLKEFFKPVNLLTGFGIIFLITFPWFFAMVQNHGFDFIKEFLSVYTFNLKSGIKAPLWFLLGFLPWSFAFLWIIGTKFKDIINSVTSYFKDNSQEKLKEKWLKLSKVEKFLSLNTILFFTTFIVTILYGTKFTYLITFMTIPAACISGYYWYEYLYRKEHAKSIFFATIIPNLLFMTFSLLGLFGYNFIKTLTVYGYNYLIVPIVIIFFIIPLIGIFSVILNGRLIAFISNLILMLSLSLTLTPGIFNFIASNSGEMDLLGFASEAHEQQVKLYTFTENKPYSLVYYFDNKVHFHDNKDFQWLKEFLTTNKKDYVVVEIKDLSAIEKQEIKYLLVESGKTYCMIKHLPITIERQIEQEAEPEVIIY